MVREVRQEGRTLYICEACKVAYAEREWAEKCQEWDEQHPGNCNLEIVQHGVSLEQE